MTNVDLIGIGLNGPAVGTTREVPQPRSSGGSGEDPIPAQAGEVSITSTAALLSQLGQALRAPAPMDPERVAALSKAVEAGTYTVQPAAVAAGLLQSERLLSGVPRTEL